MELEVGKFYKDDMGIYMVLTISVKTSWILAIEHFLDPKLKNHLFHEELQDLYDNRPKEIQWSKKS